MKRWTSFGLGLTLLVGLGQTLSAQVPAVPVAPTRNMWSFLCLSPEQLAACKLRFCNSALGRLFTSASVPIGVMSGGLLGNCCPLSPTLDELAKLRDYPESTEGAAAAIKKSEAEARARRAAVRYLGTVDCNWWPEAEDALIKALRGDTNECVRLEAAWALNRGCCCTKKTIEALLHSVSSSKRDGYPAENSIRVIGTAGAALSNCIATYIEEVEPERRKIEGVEPKETAAKETAGPGENPTPAEYYQWIQTQPMSRIVAGARRALGQAATLTRPGMSVRRAPNGLVEIITGSFGPAPADMKDRGQPVGTTPPPKSSPSTTQAPVSGTTPRSNDVRPAAHIQPEATKPIVVMPPAPKPAAPETMMPKLPAPPTPAPNNSVKMPALPAPAPNNSAKTPALPAPKSSVKTPAQPAPMPNNSVKAAAPPAPAPNSSVRLPAPPATPTPPAPLPPPRTQAPVPMPTPPTAMSTPAPKQPLAPPSMSTPAVKQHSTGTVSAPQGTTPTQMTAQQMLHLMAYGQSVDQRQQAAERLSSSPWGTHPEAIQAFVVAARQDASAAMRVTCIRCLARLNASYQTVMTTMAILKTDADANVRQEATLALDYLSSRLSGNQAQQATYRNPGSP